MLVRILKDFETNIYNLKAGQVIDLPGDVADKAVDDGNAERVEAGKPETEKAVRNNEPKAAESNVRAEAARLVSEAKKRGRQPKPVANDDDAERRLFE